MVKQGKTLFILIFFLFSILSNIFIANEAHADPIIIYVGGSGPGNYTYIQEAISIALNGDTVFVFKGTYNENILVNKSIRLIGEERNTTIIHGIGGGNAIYIIADGVNINGFFITHGNSFNNTGVKIISNFNTISENIISQNSQGILLLLSNNNHIYHNSFINNTQNANDNGINNWNDSYPSGGNYWDNYTGEDTYHGPNQDILGSDGIGDTPYNISGGINKDRYPFMQQNGWLLPLNQPPIADAQGPYFGYTNTSIPFNGSRSYDPDGIIISNTWDFGDGNITTDGWTYFDGNLSYAGKQNTIVNEGNSSFKMIGTIDANGAYPGNYQYPLNIPVTTNTTFTFSYYFPNKNVSYVGYYLTFNNSKIGYYFSLFSGSFVNNTNYYLLQYKNEITNMWHTHTSNIYNNYQHVYGVVPTGLFISEIHMMMGDPYYKHKTQTAYFDNITISSENTQFNEDFETVFQNTSHTYTISGNYTVKLSVIDNDEQNDTDTTYCLVTIADNEPPSNVTGLTVTDANDGKLNLAWNAATDNVQIYHYKIYRNNVFLLNRTTTSYQDIGLTNGQSYTYMVSAVDTSGNEGNTSNPVSGIPTATASGGSGGGETPPTGPQNKNSIADASAGEPYNGFVNSEITFDGSKSYDPDGNITKWYWVFGDNTNGTGTIVQHTYSEAGTYTVTLTVTDNNGTTNTDTTTCVITQPNRPPTTPIITGLTNGTKNTIYSYSAVSTDADNDSLQYTFTWGDGNTTTTAFIPNGTLTSQTHHWMNPGKYIITVQVFDNQTASETNELTILIDVLPIDDVIKGYLIDTNSDGIYESFNNTDTGVITEVSIGSDGSYLIDSNGDNTWDYKIDKDKKISKYPTEDETNKYIANIVIVSVGGIAFLGICYIGLTETGKYKFFVLFLSLSPLFSRIQRNEALNQEVRGNIYDYIVTNPGAHYNSIMKNLDIGNGTLSHHLNMLEKMNMVKSRREGIRYRVFYLSELQFPEAEKYRFTELQEKIIEKIKENEGIAQTKLISELGETQQTINYNIKKLERNGIIRLELKGGKTYCFYIHEVKGEK